MTYKIYTICFALFLLGYILVGSRKENLFLRLRRIEKDSEFGDISSGIRDKIKNISVIKNHEKRKYEREICDSISLLRNMVSAGQSFSLDYALSVLAQRDSYMQKAYITFLSFLRLNKKDEAVKSFEENVKTPLAREFASLLIKWDEISPSELMEILLSQQKSLNEIRKTEQKALDESISDLIYLPSVVNVMLVLINFVYVAYYVQQQKMFAQLFG